jgi:uncharacterized membrane protein YraQ (UPF0718 family)
MANSCCHHKQTVKPRPDWLLRITATAVAVSYVIAALFAGLLPEWLFLLTGTAYEMVNTMWWGMALAVLFVGLLERIPQQWVMALLGQGKSLKGILRATFAGLLLDLCSHGILMVGMKLYQRGASLGQVFAFLVASPWNSLSLTIILLTLIGWQWTLLFVLLSMLVGIVTGLIVDSWVKAGSLPENPNTEQLAPDFRLGRAMRESFSSYAFSSKDLARTVKDGLIGSKMVFRWVLLGILLAALIRAFVPLDLFQSLFGATIGGLLLTLLSATIIEVCSEGSTPIAADIFNRAQAPGNSFAFLMAGVSTDYTEIMSIRDTMKSWKLALALPLVSLPQIILLGWILNQFG